LEKEVCREVVIRNMGGRRGKENVQITGKVIIGRKRQKRKGKAK